MKLTKADEHYLKGDMEAFWKLQLQQVRSARRQLRNILRNVNASERKWGESDFTRELRPQLEDGIARCDALETTVLRELGAV